MSDSSLEYGMKISARSLAEEVGLKSLPTAFDDIWQVLMSNYGTRIYSYVDGLLHERLGKLDDVRSRIARVHHQIDHFQPDVSKYPLASVVSNIESLYREYDELLTALLASHREQAASGNESGVGADRTVLLGRLGALGRRVGNEVGANLNTLQRLLNKSDRGFIDEFYQEQRARDFLSYFCATKFGFARLYLAQIKAFVLLQMADRDPRVPYRLSNELQRFEQELLEGENRMFCTLHQEVKNLVQRLAAGWDDMHASVPVALRTPHGDGLRFGEEDGLQASSVPEEWRLELVESWLYDPHIDHRFHLRHAVTDRVLVLDGPRGTLGVRLGRKYRNVQKPRDSKLVEGWVISIDPGSLAFCLKYLGAPDDPNNGKNLVSRPDDGAPGGYKVYGRLLTNPTDRDRFFYLPFHNSAVKEQLRVDEYLRPGDCLRSPGDVYRLHYRYHGAVEVVRTSDDKVIWAAGTGVVLTATGRLLLQADGNLVAYSLEGFPYWASDKYFKDQQAVYRNSVLTLRDDGRLQIALPGKEPFWQSPA